MLANINLILTLLVVIIAKAIIYWVIVNDHRKKNTILRIELTALRTRIPNIEKEHAQLESKYLDLVKENTKLIELTKTQSLLNNKLDEDVLARAKMSLGKTLSCTGQRLEYGWACYCPSCKTKRNLKNA